MKEEKAICITKDGHCYLTKAAQEFINDEVVSELRKEGKTEEVDDILSKEIPSSFEAKVFWDGRIVLVPSTRLTLEDMEAGCKSEGFNEQEEKEITNNVWVSKLKDGEILKRNLVVKSASNLFGKAYLTTLPYIKKARNDSSYPENIVDEIVKEGINFGFLKDEAGQIDLNELYSNFEGRIGFALEKAKIKESEKGILFLHFRENISMKEIAKNYGMTGAGITTIIHKVIKVLAQPKYFLFLQCDPESVKLQASLQERVYERIKELNDRLASGKDILKEEGSILDKRLEDMDLPVRVFNTLMRAHINTVRQVIEMSIEDLMKLRNMGKRSADFIVDWIHGLGFLFKDECQELTYPKGKEMG